MIEMEKKLFETPILEIVAFNTNDVIATSGFQVGEGGDMEGGLDEW